MQPWIPVILRICLFYTLFSIQLSNNYNNEKNDLKLQFKFILYKVYSICESGYYYDVLVALQIAVDWTIANNVTNNS